MSKVEDKGRPKYDKFDKLDTATLEAILQADFDAPEAEQMPAEEILYIAGLVAERRKTPTLDVEKAKEEFYKYYYPLEEPIYDFGDDEDNKEVKTKDIQHKVDNNVLPFYKRAWRKFASVAAVFVLFTVGGTVTAYALGFNPFPVRPMWNDEQFWFEKDVPTFEMLQTVAKYENIDNLIPQWLPMGYKFDKIETAEDASRIDIDAMYIKEIADSKEAEMLHIGCLYLNDYKGTIYEKDAADVITYPMKDTDYYIMTDKEYITVVWNSGNTEYYFSGQISLEEAEKMIDSIYDD